MPPETSLAGPPTARVGMLGRFRLHNLVNPVDAVAGDQLIEHGLAIAGVVHASVRPARLSDPEQLFRLRYSSAEVWRKTWTIRLLQQVRRNLDEAPQLRVHLAPRSARCPKRQGTALPRRAERRPARLAGEAPRPVAQRHHRRWSGIGPGCSPRSSGDRSAWPIAAPPSFARCSSRGTPPASRSRSGQGQPPPSRCSLRSPPTGL